MSGSKEDFKLDPVALAARVKSINAYFEHFEQLPAMQKLAGMLLTYCATLASEEPEAPHV